MGASADRIAIEVTSSADVTAIQRATAAVSEAGQAAAKANEAVAASAVKAVEAEKGLAKATNDAAKAGGAGGSGSTGGSSGTTPAAAAVAKTSAEVDKLNPKLRTAANSMAILSQAATQGTGSMAGLAVAVGNVAQGLNALTTSAKAAQTATIIGIIVTLGVTIAEVFKSTHDRGVELDRTLKGINSETKALGQQVDNNDLAAKITGINNAVDEQINKLEKDRSLLEKIGVHQDRINLLVDGLNRKREASIALAQHERDVQLNAFETQVTNETRLSGLATDRQRTEAQLAIDRLATQGSERYNAIQLLFANKSISEEEKKRRDLLLEQNELIVEHGVELVRQQQNAAVAQLEIDRKSGSEKLTERFQAQMDQITIQRDADIKATGDVENAVRVSEQRKRALRRATALQANEDAKTIFDVLRSSNNAALKAIGSFGESVRRVIIGAEAARAAVRAAVEGGEAIASLAAGDFRGFALHGSAALELAKAAALGAQESLGGGRGASGGGGGGGGAGTFEPRQQGGGAGGQVINLYTVDPYSGEAIRVTAYHLDRSGVLKRPIYLPPTTGFAGAA